MARRDYPEIIDITPVPDEDGVHRPANVKSDMGAFMWSSFVYGSKILFNFGSWTLKQFALLMRESLRAAAEGNRELHEEMRRNRPRYARDDGYVKEDRTVHIHDNRSFFYIPTKEEERAAKLALKGK